MFKLRQFYRAPNLKEERDFERASIKEMTGRYLETTAAGRMEQDVACRSKVGEFRA